MTKDNHQGALLMEILIAVLFFALSATVILEVFRASWIQSDRAGMVQTALAEAQNLADRLSVADDPAAYLEDQGFERSDDCWRTQRDGYALNVAFLSEATEAGRLETAEVRAVKGEETLFTLPSARYLPGEVQS